jgi:hypothetical protein
MFGNCIIHLALLYDYANKSGGIKIMTLLLGTLHHSLVSSSPLGHYS